MLVYTYNKEKERNQIMGKQENIKIFEDTETLCKTNSSLKQSIKNSICNQKQIGRAHV